MAIELLRQSQRAYNSDRLLHEATAMRQIEADVVTIEAADSRGHSALVGMQSLTRHIRRKLSLIV